MSTYDKDNRIDAADNNFNTLRDRLYSDLLNLSSRHSAINTNDKSGFQNYSPPKVVSSSITETKDTKINSDPNTNPLYVIKQMIQQKYMKVTGHEAAARNIVNDDLSYINHLNDYYEIVNYWKNGTNSSDHRCNGACTGYCYESCSGGSKGKVNYGDSHCSGCNSKCVNGCSTACGSGNCKGGCSGGCYYQCKTGNQKLSLPT